MELCPRKTQETCRNLTPASTPEASRAERPARCLQVGPHPGAEKKPQTNKSFAELILLFLFRIAFLYFFFCLTVDYWLLCGWRAGKTNPAGAGQKRAPFPAAQARPCFWGLIPGGDGVWGRSGCCGLRCEQESSHSMAMWLVHPCAPLLQCRAGMCWPPAQGASGRLEAPRAAEPSLRTDFVCRRHQR